MKELNLPLSTLHPFIENYPDKEDLALKCISYGRLDVFKCLLANHTAPTLRMAQMTIPYTQVDFLQHLFESGLDSQEIKNSLLKTSLSFKQKEIQRFLLNSGADLSAVEMQTDAQPDKLHFSRFNDLEEISRIKKENILMLENKLSSDLSEKPLKKNHKI